MKSLTVMIVIVSILAANGFGRTYTGQPQYSAGTGANTAHIALDFDYGSAFVFEYHWDGDATAWDALLSLDTAEAFDVHYWDLGWGIWIYDFDYTGGSEFDYGTEVNTGWAYYTSENNSDWLFSMAGATERGLSDGSWDSWVWSNYPADWSMPCREPGEMPVPEPATLILLAFGAGMFTRKRA